MEPEPWTKAEEAVIRELTALTPPEHRIVNAERVFSTLDAERAKFAELLAIVAEWRSLANWVSHPQEDQSLIKRTDAIGVQVMEWQPMDSAPKDRTILVWTSLQLGILALARWDDDRYAKRPKPYWHFHGQDIRDARSNPPTHWLAGLEGPTS